jgi:hypothetical protein
MEGPRRRRGERHKGSLTHQKLAPTTHRRQLEVVSAEDEPLRSEQDREGARVRRERGFVHANLEPMLQNSIPDEKLFGQIFISKIFIKLNFGRKTFRTSSSKNLYKT